MTDAMATTVSRRVWFARLLLALGVVLTLGTMVVPEVDASKKSKARIAREVKQFQRDCKDGGGTFEVSKRPGGTTASCTGGDYAGDGSDGTTCTFHSKGTRCHLHLTHSPAPLAGGGGAVPPGDNGNEDPGDGGADPGGGGGIDPGWEADPDGDGPSGPVLE
jgi:hypothetical protein